MRRIGWAAMLALSIPIAVAAGGQQRGGREVYLGLAGGEQACAACHGLSGQGGGEGGTVVPAIGQLVGPGKAYRDPARLCRAVNAGTAAGGLPIARSMPRYRLSTSECATLWAFLATRDERPPPGIDERSIVVRLTPAPVSRSQLRWRDVLAQRFGAINRAGGLYGREIVLIEGEGPAAFSVSFEARRWRTDVGIGIMLRYAGQDPTLRGVESDATDETAALVEELGARGVRRVRWIDETGSQASEDVRLIALGRQIEIRDEGDCTGSADEAVVVRSARAALSPACASAAEMYLDLRQIAVDSLSSLLAARPVGKPIAVFAAMPFDSSFSEAPLLVAEVIIDTVRSMSGNPTELRQLAAFDQAWRSRAAKPGTLFAGVAVQSVEWPTMRNLEHPRWVAAPN